MNEPNGGNAGNNGQEPEKTFTQAELDRIVGDRLAREREKYAGFDDYKTKAGNYDDEKKRADDLQKQIDAMNAEKTRGEMLDKVSKETGVPVNLLTGADEDACRKQAEAINAYAKPKNYPGTAENRGSTGGKEYTEGLREAVKNIFGKGD